jgi:hypothetical protein
LVIARIIALNKSKKYRKFDLCQKENAKNAMYSNSQIRSGAGGMGGFLMLA